MRLHSTVKLALKIITGGTIICGLFALAMSLLALVNLNQNDSPTSLSGTEPPRLPLIAYAEFFGFSFLIGLTIGLVGSFFFAIWLIIIRAISFSTEHATRYAIVSFIVIPLTVLVITVMALTSMEDHGWGCTSLVLNPAPEQIICPEYRQMPNEGMIIGGFLGIVFVTITLLGIRVLEVRTLHCGQLTPDPEPSGVPSAPKLYSPDD